MYELQIIVIRNSGKKYLRNENVYMALIFTTDFNVHVDMIIYVYAMI